VVSKPQIAFESKAQADEKAQSSTHSGGWAFCPPPAEQSSYSAGGGL